MSNETAEALAMEAKHGLAAGSSIQILITGYPTWLAITEMWDHGDLWKITLGDGSAVLIGREALIGVRFGEVDESD